MKRQPLVRFSAVIYVGGFWQHHSAPVVIDMQGIRRARAPILTLDGQRVGHVNEMRIDHGMLLVAGVLHNRNEKAREVELSAADGYTWQTRMQLEVGKADRFTDATVNNRRFDGSVAVVTESYLRGIEVCSNGDEDSVFAVQ